MDTQLYNLIGKAVNDAEKNGGDLTTKNLRYVWSVATDVASKNNVDVYDLFVEGVLGMKSAELKYDPTKNDNFVKYAASSVRGYMLNFINRKSSPIHIPVNHLNGFKKGQNAREEATNIQCDSIDAYDYDTLGSVDMFAFNDKYDILQRGIEQLDEAGRIAIKMKLRLNEYQNLKKTNMKTIADELEVPVNIASKIYKDALKKLTKYCQAEYYG